MNERPDLELDCRGLPCPQPVIELARRIGEVTPGGLIAVLSTDVAARSDIAAWCRMRGHEYVGAETLEDEVTRHLVRLTT